MSFPVQPYSRAFAITPGTAFHQIVGSAFPPVIYAIYVGGAGNISVVTARGDTVVFTAVPVGTLLPVQCSAVNSSGTTATNLVGLWG